MFVNVFVAVSIQGKLTVWAKTQYATRDKAIDAKEILPDGGFVYVATIPANKIIDVTVLR